MPEDPRHPDEESPPRRRAGAAIARPFAFATLMAYGLTCFMMGQQDWRELHRLPQWAAGLLVVGGILLGSAAVRVFLRRRRAFGQSLLVMSALLIANLFTGLTVTYALCRLWFGGPTGRCRRPRRGRRREKGGIPGTDLPRPDGGHPYR